MFKTQKLPKPPTLESPNPLKPLSTSTTILKPPIYNVMYCTLKVKQHQNSELSLSLSLSCIFSISVESSNGNHSRCITIDLHALSPFSLLPTWLGMFTSLCSSNFTLIKIFNKSPIIFCQLTFQYYSLIWVPLQFWFDPWDLILYVMWVSFLSILISMCYMWFNLEESLTP